MTGSENSIVDNWGFLFLLFIAAYVILNGISAFLQKFLKIDRSEREQLLQNQLSHLSEKIGDYESEISDLRKLVKLLQTQYEEMVGKYKELQHVHEEARQESQSLREQLNNLSQGYIMRDTHPNKVLIVCVGSPDKGLGLDLATIRAVRTDTGLEIQTIQDPSPDNLKKFLDRARMKQDHIYVHLAVKADKEGYQLGETIVDASWLSSVLNGAIVLLVAGADSDNVGDFLGVVPYVITMSGGVTHRDAAIFSRLFWTEIGRGIGPSLALTRALDRSPGTIREQIVSHWN